MAETKSLSGELAAEYSERADAYARLWAPVIGPMARRLLRTMPISEANRVLDLGCGTGELLPDVGVAAPKAVVFGVDRAAGMLLQARRKSDCQLAVMDARRLAFSDRAFDGVLLSFVLFHVPDPLAALREVERVLRPAGILGLVVWGQSDTTPWDVIWREELDARGADPDPRDARLMQHALMDTEEKLSSLLAKSGLDVTELWSETFEHRWDVEALFELQTSCGSQHRRLESLPEAARDECRKRVRRRLAALPANRLVFRPVVLFSTARSAAAADRP